MILGIILRYNAEKLQEILNRIMQRIMSIITSALVLVKAVVGLEQQQ